MQIREYRTIALEKTSRVNVIMLSSDNKRKTALFKAAKLPINIVFCFASDSFANELLTVSGEDGTV